MRHLCIRQLFVNFAQLACAAHRHALLRAIAGTAPINTHLKQMRKYGHILTYTFISILTAGIVACGGGEQSQKELDALMNANAGTMTCSSNSFFFVWIPHGAVLLRLKLTHAPV